MGALAVWLASPELDGPGLRYLEAKPDDIFNHA